MPQFDVFLSHSSVDKPWVVKLKDDLLRYNVSVWLDQDEIRPGDLFGEALEQALDNCRTVALIVSPAAISSGWVKEEYYRALQLATKQSPLQLIPIIFREAELPGFLQSRNWVDFRDESTYDTSVWKLVWGITGKKPTQVLDLTLDTSSSSDHTSKKRTGFKTIQKEYSIVYDVAKIRKLLENAFYGDEIDYFCFDNFREVHRNFSSGMTHSAKIQRLLAYCESRMEFEKLLDLVSQINPARYKQFEQEFDVE